jgi:hypothetical protein
MEVLEEKYLNDPEFLEFVNREFRSTAMHASIEELAEFAFGSIEDAIEEYNESSDDSSDD